MVGKYKELTDVAIKLIRDIFEKNEIIGRAMLTSGNQRWQVNLREIVENNKTFNKSEFAQVIYDEICKTKHKDELINMFLNYKSENYTWFINAKKKAKLGQEEPKGIILNTYYRDDNTIYLKDEDKISFAKKNESKLIKEITDFYIQCSQVNPSKYVGEIIKNINSIDDIDFNSYKSIAYTIDDDKLSNDDIKLIEQQFKVLHAESINKYVILGYINLNLNKYHLHSFDDTSLTLVHLVESSCRLKIIDNNIILLFSYTNDKMDNDLDEEMREIQFMKINVNDSMLNLLSLHNNLYLSGYLDKTKINYAKTS